MLLDDCERLVVVYFPAISGSALQLYHSVLSFIPSKTTLARTYANECIAENSVKVFRGMTDFWDACLGTVTAHGGNWVTAVDFSPDGRTIVSSGNDGEIRIWDALTCTLLLVLPDHPNCVNSVKFSLDGTRIVSAANDCMVKIWNAVSGVLLCTLEGHTKWVNCALFTPDGRRIVSSSWDHSIKIWDADTGACLTTLMEHQEDVRSIAVSPDGLWMASGAGDLVCLWSLEAPYTHHVLLKQGHNRLSYSITVTFTPDSSKVLTALEGASFNLGQLSIWDVKTAMRLRNLQPSGKSSPSILSPSFLSAGDKFACGSGKSVLVLDLASDEVLQAFAGHTDSVTCVSFNRDGTRIVSGSQDGTVRLWDTAQGAVNMPQHKNAARSPDPSSKESADCRLAVFSHDRSRALLICDNDSIEVDKTDTWDRAYEPLSLPSARGHYAAFSPDDAVILTASEGGRGGVALWNAASGSLQAQWKGRLDVAFWSPSFQDTLMWSSISGCMPHCFGGQSSSIMFSPDSRYLLTAAISGAGDFGEDSACLWDVATGQLISEFVGHSGRVHSVAFSLNGRRIAMRSHEETVIVWDVATRACVATCRGRRNLVCSVAFSPDGERVVSGDDDGCVLVWSAEGGELLQSFEGHTGWVWSAAFAPGGDLTR